ncbi:MAG: cytochrome [Alphaproteobacteria bacterium]|nr:cytochrome [Alphaproteobacteria bacterium]
MAELVCADPGPLPVGPVGRSGMGWWGVATLIASEAALFGFLVFAYFYVGATAQPGWLLEPAPKLFPALPNTLLLLASSGAAWWGEKGVERGRRHQAVAGLLGAFVMGAVFAGVQAYEWSVKTYGMGESSYASLYYVTTGLHMAHVLVGLVILLTLAGWTAAGFFSQVRWIPVSAGILYWHFVDVVWLFVFAAYYLTPYLGFPQ